MHITVDYDLCEGHGQCLMAAPELFDLPDGADQVVVLDPNPPESERDRAVHAFEQMTSSARVGHAENLNGSARFCKGPAAGSSGAGREPHAFAGCARPAATAMASA